MLLEKFTTLERTQREMMLSNDVEERRLRQELNIQTRANIDGQVEIDQLKQKLFEVDEKHESILNQHKTEIIHLKQTFLDLKKLFEKKLVTEKQHLSEHVSSL